MRKKIVFLFIFIVILLGNITQAKYRIEETILIAKMNIDTISPEIIVTNITSMPYPEYENKIAKIKFELKVMESNIKENKFNKNQIIVMVENEKIEKELYEINKISQTDHMILYEVKLEKIETNKEVKIRILEGTIQDRAGHKNSEKIISYQIPQ